VKEVNAVDRMLRLGLGVHDRHALFWHFADDLFSTPVAMVEERGGALAIRTYDDDEIVLAPVGETGVFMAEIETSSGYRDDCAIRGLDDLVHLVSELSRDGYEPTDPLKLCRCLFKATPEQLQQRLAMRLGVGVEVEPQVRAGERTRFCPRCWEDGTPELLPHPDRLHPVKALRVTAGERTIELRPCMTEDGPKPCFVMDYECPLSRSDAAGSSGSASTIGWCDCGRGLAHHSRSRREDGCAGRPSVDADQKRSTGSTQRARTGPRAARVPTLSLSTTGFLRPCWLSDLS
jgi:hypothetical protein